MAKAISPFFLHSLPNFNIDNPRSTSHYDRWETKAKEMNLAPFAKITRDLVDLLVSRGGANMGINDEWSPFLYRMGQWVLLLVLPIGDDGRAYARLGYKLKILDEKLEPMSITRDVQGDMDVVGEIEAFVNMNFTFRKDCPKCHGPLVRKIAEKVEGGPRSFLSCETYPICRGAASYRIDPELGSLYLGISRAELRRLESEPWRSKRSRIAHREYLERKGIRAASLSGGATRSTIRRSKRRPTMEECERAEQARLPWPEP